MPPLFQTEEERKMTKKQQPVSETKKKPPWKVSLTKTLTRLGAKSKQEQVPNSLNRLSSMVPRVGSLFVCLWEYGPHIWDFKMYSDVTYCQTQMCFLHFGWH